MWPRSKKQDAVFRSQQQLNRWSIILHHYCPHTFNAGDHFVIRSIRKHLQQLLPEAVFVPKASAFNRGWGKPVRLAGENIGFSNRYADAVIVGGSDQYNNWALRIRGKEIAGLVPPLYLIGMGISSKQLAAPPHLKKKSYREDIRRAHEKARLCAVRDEYTARFLADCGYRHAVVTGCPALYLSDQPFQLRETGPVALTFPFPVIRRGEDRRYEQLIHLMQMLVRLIREMGRDPVLVCHDDRDVPPASELFPEETIFSSNYVDDFFDFYRGVSLVIGSRLHATILAAGMGIPFINVNLDARGQGFSETFALQDWNLNIDDPDLNGKIRERISSIVQGDLDMFKSFTQKKTAYKDVFLQFMQNVAQDIRRQLKQASE